jgi:hypothetical protein
VALSDVQERIGGVLWPQKIHTEQESKLLADRVDRANDEAIMNADRPMIEMHDTVGIFCACKGCTKRYGFGFT